MFRRTFSSLALFVFAYGIFGSVAAQAELINYGGFAGDTVDFRRVTESTSGALPAGGLFGEPTVNGDSLHFDAPGFALQSTAGGVDFLDGRLRFNVEARDGFLIDSIMLREFGNFFGVGDHSTEIVNALAFVIIGNQVINGSFFRQFDGTGTGAWFGDLEINFDPVDKVSFVMDNQLFTRADASGVAFIDKKDIRIDVHTIPEPSSAIFFLIGVVGVVSTSRRLSNRSV